MYVIRHAQEHLHVTSKFNYVYRDAQLRSDIPGQHFLETYMLLSYNNNQDHTFMGDYIIPVLNQQTRPLLYLWRPDLTQTPTMP